MKVPVWVNMSEEELVSKNADELHVLFGCSIKLFETFCEQSDVSFDVKKKVATWGTCGLNGNKHPLTQIKLIDCDSDQLRAIREERYWIDFYDDIIMGILFDRGEVDTCENCKFLIFDETDEGKTYECPYRDAGERSEVTIRYKCGNWEEKLGDKND